MSTPGDVPAGADGSAGDTAADQSGPSTPRRAAAPRSAKATRAAKAAKEPVRRSAASRAGRTGDSELPGAADVVVVGAGPAGSSAAYHLASSGLDVVLLEKTGFPREKVCGDGLTPRAVKQLVDLGVDVTAPGWIRNKGLRVIGGGVRLELNWPDLADYPSYGLVRTRYDLDQLLAGRATAVGARLFEHTTVTGPLLDRAGRVVGVTATTGQDKRSVAIRAPLVLACDGVSGRLALSLGIARKENRPMGVAVRRYFTSPRHDDDYLESWLELWDSRSNSPTLLPGYGWIFGVGDGRSNVGLGVLNTSSSFQQTDYRQMLAAWLGGLPDEWGYTEDNATGPVRGAALPMGFNRTPHYTRGLLLAGDAAGMVNPFNGEGIAYAMEGGAMAAEHVVQALARREGPTRERVLAAYPRRLRQTYGGYYRLGGIFVDLIGHPEVMRLCTYHGLPHATLMRFVLKLLANLTDRRDGDVADRVINALTRLAPAV